MQNQDARLTSVSVGRALLQQGLVLTQAPQTSLPEGLTPAVELDCALQANHLGHIPLPLRLLVLLQRLVRIGDVGLGEGGRWQGGLNGPCQCFTRPPALHRRMTERQGVEDG